MNYEDKEKDNINDVAYFLKKLLIDTSQELFLDIDTINKFFLTQLDLFQNNVSANIINILVVNIFK